MKTKVVLSLSGGMDSTTLLGYVLDKVDKKNSEVICCSFFYGSKHNRYELKAAVNIVDFYKAKGFIIKHFFFNLSTIFAGFNSSLMKGGGEIPEGHYNEDTMKSTVVPGRNLIFASILAGFAESEGASEIYLGVHSGDHHIYPDCRPEFFNALEEVITNSTEGKVQVQSPFLYEDKTSILKIGYALSPQVPYTLTRTCYKEQEKACGRCGSCQERLEAFANINIKDPVSYE